MKVEIKQPHRKLDGDVGDVVEIDAPLGHHLAGIGKVVIVEHDKPKVAGCVVQLAPGVIKDKEVSDEPDKERVFTAGGDTRPLPD